MSAVFTELCIDCADPLKVATFWSEVLGWKINTDKDYYWMSETGEHTSFPMLVFVDVPERKTTKNRLHIDVNPSGTTQEEELKRLLSLGATHADVGQKDVPWIVLQDVEGNEFCLLARVV